MFYSMHGYIQGFSTLKDYIVKKDIDVIIKMYTIPVGSWNAGTPLHGRCPVRI